MRAKNKVNLTIKNTPSSHMKRMLHNHVSEKTTNSMSKRLKTQRRVR